MVRPMARMLLTALAATFTVGCDRGGDEGSVGGAGATPPRPAATRSDTAARSTTSPATTLPATTRAAAESLFNIDGNLVLFPAAKMRIDESDGKTVVRLFSDDPKGAALDENYQGNSFYLQIEMDPEDARDLNGVQLTYRAPSSERDDSPYGIFQGRRWVLQPADMRVLFEGTGSPIDVQLSGTFLMFDTTDETAKPQHAKVFAELSATVQARK